jgi:hypothetical protein
VLLIVLILLTLVLSYLAWQLVHCSPRVLSLILPRALTIAIGMFLFVLGIFVAFLSAEFARNPSGVLGGFVQVYAGLWFMLATSAGMRGAESDERMLRRLFVMIGLAMGTLIGALYLPETRAIAVLNLMLITSGFWITTNYLHQLDRGG